MPCCLSSNTRPKPPPCSPSSARSMVLRLLSFGHVWTDAEGVPAEGGEQGDLLMPALALGLTPALRPFQEELLPGEFSHLENILAHPAPHPQIPGMEFCWSSPAPSPTPFRWEHQLGLVTRPSPTRPACVPGNPVGTDEYIAAQNTFPCSSCSLASMTCKFRGYCCCIARLLACTTAFGCSRQHSRPCSLPQAIGPRCYSADHWRLFLFTHVYTAFRVASPSFSTLFPATPTPCRSPRPRMRTCV